MSKKMLDLVLPRIARVLSRQLKSYRAGRMDDATFSSKFDSILQQHCDWLHKQGYQTVDSSITVHAALIVLSSPGLKAESKRTNLPLEIIEFRAICEAGKDLAQTLEIPASEAIDKLSSLVAFHMK
ncbi:MAG: hypothetical protein EXR99_12615 [Gemmataceae bacterium]|nr:hypothetical protein [Gemmataceae bacterium]